VHSTPFPRGPIVLGGQPWTSGVVLDRNPAAAEMGIRRGMPLGSAHRLSPEAVFLDPDPAADAAALEAALERLAAFSPGIAAATDPSDAAFGRIEVHVDGLRALWGEEPAMVGRMQLAVASILPGPARGGVAGTHFTATIAAGMAGADPIVVPVGGDAAFLAPLPAGLLTPDHDVRGRLSRFGLTRIGAVAELPRTALVARFGEEGARMYARAHGEEIVPFRPRCTPERLRLRLPLEPAVADLEPLRFVLRRLVGALGAQLAARGAATTRALLRLTLDTTFVRDRTTPRELELEQRLPEPTAEAEAIERLLYAQFERTPPPAPVEVLDLELLDVGPAVGQQLPMFVPQAARSARLGWQLARLAVTFGEDRISRVEIADPEAPLAEARWRWLPIDSGARRSPGFETAEAPASAS
jgi:protein ImuB